MKGTQKKELNYVLNLNIRFAHKIYLLCRFNLDERIVITQLDDSDDDSVEWSKILFAIGRDIEMFVIFLFLLQDMIFAKKKKKYDDDDKNEMKSWLDELVS